MRMTADLGAKVLRVFLGWPGVTLLAEGGGSYDFAKAVWVAEHQGFSSEQTWAWCRTSLTEAARLAGDFGVTLALRRRIRSRTRWHHSEGRRKSSGRNARLVRYRVPGLRGL